MTGGPVAPTFVVVANTTEGDVGMTAVSKDQAPLEFDAGVALARALQAGGMTLAFEAMQAGAATAPVFVLAGPAGAIVDRFDRRRVLLLVSLAQAPIAVALAFVDATAATLALTALLGAGFAVAQPAEFALLPALVGEERLAAANGR